jgi:hypothetical protein
MARILIGTSGWHYGPWRGPFYPPGLTLKQQLQYRRCSSLMMASQTFISLAIRALSSIIYWSSLSQVHDHGNQQACSGGNCSVGRSAPGVILAVPL